jgi:hydrogenase expression/formation protein HypC
MCLAIPAKIIKITGNEALVAIGETLLSVNTSLTDDILPGDYVIVHAGFAIEKLSQHEAIETINQIIELKRNGMDG